MIRQAKKADAKQVLSLMKDLYLTWDGIDYMDRIDHNWFNSRKGERCIINRIKNGKLIVAEVDNSIVGYCYGEIETREPLIDADIGLIDEIYVSFDARGKGYGKALTQEVIDWFSQKKLRWCIVLTHSQDDSANRYWQAAGFTDYNRKYRMKL